MSATLTTSSKPADEEHAATGLLRGNGLRTVGLLVLVGVLAVVFVLSLVVGDRSIPLGEVWQLLRFPDASENSWIINENRLPRAWIALLVGAALGVAGALIQALTRNPLADTGILGVGAGASFAVVLGIAFFGATSIHHYLWFAFVGAVAVTVLVYVFGSLGSLGATPVRLTLVGVALGALLGGISGGITMLDPKLFESLTRWSAGSLAGRGWDTFQAIRLVIVLGLILGLCCARPLNAIALGDDLAKSLGANVTLTRTVVIVAVTVLAGAATAAAGPIGFVGLMVPHVVRWFTGPEQRWIIAYTLVCAPILLIASDVLARVILPHQELEVGIITAFLGAPVLILLARRRKVSGL